MKAEFAFWLFKISLYMSILESLEYTDKQKVESKNMKRGFLEILIGWWMDGWNKERNDWRQAI